MPPRAKKGKYVEPPMKYDIALQQYVPDLESIRDEGKRSINSWGDTATSSEELRKQRLAKQRQQYNALPSGKYGWVTEIGRTAWADYPRRYPLTIISIAVILLLVPFPELGHVGQGWVGAAILFAGMINLFLPLEVKEKK